MCKILIFDKSLTTLDQLLWQSETNSWMKDSNDPEWRIVCNPHISTDTFGTALGYDWMTGFVNRLRLNFPFRKETIFCAMLYVVKKCLNSEYNWRFKLKYFFGVANKRQDSLRVTSNYYLLCMLKYRKAYKNLQQMTDAEILSFT
jgi:hypothetical protein